MPRAFLAAAALLFATLGCSKPSAQPAGSASPSASAPPIASLLQTIPPLPKAPLDRPTASKLVSLSIACADKEYPHKPDQVLERDQDLQPSRVLTPSFFGCFDWHSAVHGHWAMLRVLNRFPDLAEAPVLRKTLDQHLTDKRLAQEVAFFQESKNRTVERPYGWGWLLRLAAEAHVSQLPEARNWETALHPLASLLGSRLLEYLARLSVPLRAGTHANTAFSLVHALDYARTVGDTKLAAGIEQRARDFYLRDQRCPTAYEPSGEDFISPCLAEADLMRRVLPSQEFLRWLEAFLPPLNSPDFEPVRRPVEVKDRQDARIVHLVGLSLQRAWCLEGIASLIPASDERRLLLERISALHQKEGLQQMFDSGYGGAHWLASFAIYLLTSP